MKNEEDQTSSVSGMLRKIGISCCGFYAFIHRKPSKQKIRKEEIPKRIEEIHEESHQIYGAPKITVELRKEGYNVSEKYVGNIMREKGFKAHYIKPYTITARDCNFSSRLKNILNREFNPGQPNSAWCTDITYVWTNDEGFVYLTSVMDLYSKKIISWKLSKTMEVKEVLECVKEAKSRRKSENSIIINSDRGVQFISKTYYDLTAGMIVSYSKKGNLWDNASCIESLHSLIKREWLNRQKIQNWNHAYRLIFEYIEGFYNTVRIHSRCDYLSLNEYEQKCELNNYILPFKLSKILT